MENTALDARIVALEKDNEALRKNIDEIKTGGKQFRQGVYDRLNALEQNRARTEEQYSQIMVALRELKDVQKTTLQRLDTLSAKPAKRYETAITTSISAVVGAVIGFIMNR